MGAETETELSPPPLELGGTSPEPEILRNDDDRKWKADMMSALGESVSFGRFLSEPLEWGKWSAFEHNRYQEEAAGQSRPGSVAQKKAFFEDHYARKRRESQDDAGADEDVDVEDDADADGGVACWSAAGSSCMTDEPAGEEMRGVDSSPAGGVIVDASQDLKDVANVVGLSCSMDNTDEPSHKQDDVQVTETRNGLQLDDAVATVDSVEKQPLQESSIVNQGTTNSVKKRRLPIASLFQRPTEFSSPPSGKKKTPCSSVKRRFRSAKENSSPSPSTDSNKQEGASVAHKRSTFGSALHMSINFRRCETSNPASRSRNLGSTIASRISQFESASRPVKDTHPKVNQLRQTRKGFFKGMPEIASRTSQQHEQRSSHVSVTRLKEKLFSSTSSPTHPKTNLAKENMVNANNESELKEFRPSIPFKARPLPNFSWKNKEAKDSSQQIAQEIQNLPNSDHQLNDASNPHVMSRGAPKDKQICCFPLRRLC